MEPNDIERFDEEAWADEVLRPKMIELRDLAKARGLPILISAVFAIKDTINKDGKPEGSDVGISLIAALPAPRTPSNMSLAAFVLQHPPDDFFAIPVGPNGPETPKGPFDSFFGHKSGPPGDKE